MCGWWRSALGECGAGRAGGLLLTAGLAPPPRARGPSRAALRGLRERLSPGPPSPQRRHRCALGEGVREAGGLPQVSPGVSLR